MLGVRLTLSFTQEKTCFAYINSKYSTNNEQSQSVNVFTNNTAILLWVVFNNGIPEGHIACNPTHSKLVGLEEGADVFVTSYSDIKDLDELFIEANSPDDQEILEHNAELLQTHILDQLRLVVANQKAVIWISPSLPIVFTPKQTGLLVNQSKVIVKINAFNSIDYTPSTSTTDSKENKSEFKNIGMINDEMLQPYLNRPEKLVLRAIPIDSDGKRNLIHPYIVFMHEDIVDKKYKDSTVILATMKSIPSVLNPEEDNENTFEINDLCVEVVPIDSVIFRSLCREVYNKNILTVLLPKSLNAIVNVETGIKIIFTFIGDIVEQPEHIEIVTYYSFREVQTEIIEKFKTCVIDSTHSGKKFLINHGMVKKNLEISKGLLQFNLKPDNIKYTMLNSESFRNCTISARCLLDVEMTVPKVVRMKKDYECINYCRSMKSVESLVEKIISHLYFELHRDATFKGISEIKSNVLLTGLSGTGKSAISHIIRRELTVWSNVFHCRLFKGRKDVATLMSGIILSCQEHSPSVFICEDLETLVPSNLEGYSPQDVAYYQRLVIDIKKLLQNCPGVCVLMTSQSMNSLHPTLRQFRGKALFTAQFNTPELQQQDRLALLNHLLNDSIRSEFTVGKKDVAQLAMEMAGYTVREVTDQVNRIVFNAVKKQCKDYDNAHPRLIERDSRKKEKAEEFDIWSPVGGLNDVKQELTECIFWPIMYPALFPSQSCGILLYGPPGTGKSHIGSCLAKITSMQMITVKGPELLSKYIGQSEKAVRDVFDKADMKRPCILFFDEFDSIAPKRGHDSTGVTDRVVNQLLARLDGAEGGARGPVLAATSRPDLLDPALLRAGRLQRHIYCALPDQQGRYEVLRTLAKSVALDESVDLQKLAEATDGFSPADLKSVLVTAQLTRLEKQLVQSEDKNMDSVVVYAEDIKSALEETKPSLSKQQRLFYDMIYKRFRGETLTAEQKSLSNEFLRQRVTLA